MKYLILITAFIISGCAQKFTRPDYTEQGFEQDSTECEVMANQAGQTFSLWQKRSFMKRCMVGKGWTAE